MSVHANQNLQQRVRGWQLATLLQAKWRLSINEPDSRDVVLNALTTICELGRSSSRLLQRTWEER